MGGRAGRLGRVRPRPGTGVLPSGLKVATLPAKTATCFPGSRAAVPARFTGPPSPGTGDQRGAAPAGAGASLIAGNIFASLRSDCYIALAPLGPSLSPRPSLRSPRDPPQNHCGEGYESGTCLP